MDVDIAGQVIRLEQQQVVGLGGEGTVFLVTIGNQKRAVKVYHTPTPQRQEKLSAFLKQSWKLPQRKIALPLQVVRDTAQGNVIGLTMPYVDTGFEEIGQLANKKHRTAFLVSTRQITNIFLDGATSLACIHASGLVVGDFNDQNILYKQDTMLWIDVDAWQFSLYPCPVGSEDFLAPELYGIDLHVKPVFKPEHDWYSFAVHLFRSLLLAHPYGGTHKTALSLIQRAQQHLFVVHPDVKYPKMAYSPDLLSDELAQVFERVFARGWRGTFPLEVLREYQDSLVPCSTCAMHYPRSRRVCPLCSAKVLITVPQPLVGSMDVSVTELLRTPGKFVFFKVEGETIHALAYEQGNAILYSKKPGLGLKRKELFKELPGAHYDLLGNVLIVNTLETTQLLFVDIFGDKPVALCQSETAVFAPWRKAVFQASRTHIYSIQNNALMWSNVEDGALSGRSLRSVMEKQTWFTVAQTTDDGKPTVFGFFQVFHQQMYWLIRGHALYDVALLPLLPGEVLIDIAAYFSNQSVLIRRSTRERGVDYLRTDLIDTSGKVVSTSSRIRQSDHPCPGLYGPVYGSGMLLHATDNGIVQEKIENGTFKTFSATYSAVQQGDTLERYQAGLLILGESRVDYLVLN